MEGYLLLLGNHRSRATCTGTPISDALFGAGQINMG